MPSSTTRLRTSFFVRLRTASLISLLRPANSPGASEVPASAAMVSATTASVAALRSAFCEIVIASPSFVAKAPHGLPDVVAVVEDLGVRQRLDRAVSGDVLRHEVLLECDRP